MTLIDLTKHDLLHDACGDDCIHPDHRSGFDAKDHKIRDYEIQLDQLVRDKEMLQASLKKLLREIHETHAILDKELDSHKIRPTM